MPRTPLSALNGVPKPEPRLNARCRKDLHDMSPENVYIEPSTGNRRCRACRRPKMAVYQATWRRKNGM